MDECVNEWISAYRDGHVDALGRLVEHYRRPLFGFILKMTEAREDAEEIFQEVWFRAIRSMDQYREKSFLSWLFRIAHNLIIDRARKIRPSASLDAPIDGNEESSLAARLPAKGIAPSGELEAKDMAARIQWAVSKLPPEQKEVFLLRTEGGASFKEIARLQKVSINTALARMQYALGKLREELKSEYGNG